MSFEDMNQGHRLRASSVRALGTCPQSLAHVHSVSPVEEAAPWARVLEQAGQGGLRSPSPGSARAFCLPVPTAAER